jgi:membrane fusion protein (multidrug efflux system)
MSGRAIFREGALISPGKNSLLTQLYVIDPIWVNFTISENDLLKARSLQQKEVLHFPKDDAFEIEVILADNSVVPAEGKIDFAAPALQPETGTLLVRAILSNSNRDLLPGQFVRVVLKGATWPNAITVPQTAIFQGQAGTYVFIVTDEGKAEARSVVTGEWYKDDWIILSGLQKGDVVITGGVNRLENGSLVQVKKE